MASISSSITFLMKSWSIFSRSTSPSSSYNQYPFGSWRNEEAISDGRIRRMIILTMTSSCMEVKKESMVMRSSRKWTVGTSVGKQLRKKANQSHLIIVANFRKTRLERKIVIQGGMGVNFQALFASINR